MRDNVDASARRRFLSLAAGTGIAALAGCTSALPTTLNARMADASLTVGTDTDGLSADDRERYVDRMAQRYGSRAADRIVPNAGDVDLQPGLEPAALVWAGERSLSVTDSSGETLAESDNYAAVYEADEDYAADGSAHYVYWLWSCARPREAGELRELRSHVDVTGGGDVLLYDPGGDVSDNGTVGPDPARTGQDADAFALRWRGEHADTQVATGSLSERRGDGELGFEWAVHLAAVAR